MKLRTLYAKLVAAARANPPGNAVPYAFEQRIMARIRGYKPQDQWYLWSNALWRAALACVFVALLSGAWSIWSNQQQDVTGDFSTDFELAVAAVDEQQLDDAW
jgi:hypothetical protein